MIQVLLCCVLDGPAAFCHKFHLLESLSFQSHFVRCIDSYTSSLCYDFEHLIVPPSVHSLAQSCGAPIKNMLKSALLTTEVAPVGVYQLPLLQGFVADHILNEA